MRRKLSHILPVVVAAVVLAAGAAHGQTWTGPGTDWNTASAWSTGVIPNSGTAVVNFTGNAIGTINISSKVLSQSLNFSNTTGAYTLMSSPSVVLSGVTGINVAANVTGTQTINLANIGAGSLVFPSGSNLNITNNSTAPGTTLLIGPSTVIGTNGSGGVIVNGPGNTTISGGFATGLQVFGGLQKNGNGTLTLSNSANYYDGNTFVNGGTLQLGSGSAIPTGSSVTVAAGAQFNIGSLSNGSSTAIGQLALNGGTFRVPSGAGDYYLTQVTMTGNSTVDFTGTSNSFLHFVNSGAGITVSSGNSTWIGSGSSRIVNESGAVLPINVAPGSNLTLGVILSSGGGQFQLTGGGSVTLTNTGNTANIANNSALVITNDLSTNVGSGAFGTLGTGFYTNVGGLQYTGGTATSAKAITLGNSFTLIQVASPGANLTMNGTLSGGGGLQVDGSFNQINPSTLTLTAANTFAGNPVVPGGAILAIPTIADTGTACPIGTGGGVFLGAPGSRGTLMLTGTNLNYSTNRIVSVRGLYTQGYGGAIGVQNPGTTLTLSGQITDVGSLIKTGPGTLVLSNNTNNHTGGTYVEAGTLAIGGAGAVIPAGSNVTVNSGAIFDFGNGSGANNSGAAINVTLNNGVLRFSGGAGYPFFLTQLAIGATGGTVDFTGASNVIARFTGAGAGITVNANAATTALWTGTNNCGFQNNTSSPLTITVAQGTTASGIDLDSSIVMKFSGGNYVKAGPGTMRVANSSTDGNFTVTSGRLRVDDTAMAGLGTGIISLDGGTLTYGNPSANGSSTRDIPFTAAGGGIDVTAAAVTLTLTGTLGGSSGLTKIGQGTLVLTNNANSFTSITVSQGTLRVNSESALGGVMPITVNSLGTLLYPGNATTSRTFNLTTGSLRVAAGSTLTFSNAQVGGGFLRGAFATMAGQSTNFAGGTLAPSSALTVSGVDSLVNVTNSGALTMAGGPAATSTLDLFTNQGSGSITVAATSKLNASDFQTYGTLTLNPATVTQNFSQTTLMTNTGTTPLYFNGGSRTFVGTPATAVFPNNWPDPTLRGLPTFVAGIDLNGKNATVAGGLFVNNGYVEDTTNNGQGTATVIADFGSLVKGAGYFQNSVQTINGGKFQAGNSPGAATFGKFVLGPGGVSSYVFAIDDATGAAEPSPDSSGHVSGWGLVRTVAHAFGSDYPGDFTWTATPADKLTVSIQTLLNPTTVGIDVPGMMDHFDPTHSYLWPAVEWTGSYAGPVDAAVLDDSTAFDMSGFANPVAGHFGWSFDAGSHRLSLTYAPSAVPEPSSFALLTAAIGAARSFRRRFFLVSV